MFTPLGRFARVTFSVAGLILLLGRPAAADPLAQLSPADRALVAAARTAVDASCDCAAAGHRTYVRCVGKALKAEVTARRLLRKQMHAAMQCASQSTCGRAGWVSCCKTTRKGKTRCRVMPAAKCTAPRRGSACVAPFASSCDAAAQGCALGEVPLDVQCCLPTSPGGAFPDQPLSCELLKPDECTALGGTVAGPGTCEPDPCGTVTTTTSTTTSTTLPQDVPCCVPLTPGSGDGTCEFLKPEECTGLGGILVDSCPAIPCTIATTTTTTTESSSTTTSTSSTTTTTVAPPIVACCLQTSAGGAFDRCEQLTADACASAGGQDRGPGSCEPNPCLEPTTTSTTTTSTTTESTATSTTETTTSTTETTTTTTESTTTTTESTSTTESTTTTTSTSSTTTTTEPQAFCGKGVKGHCSVSVDKPGCSFDNLQEAIDHAHDGATITVEGRCWGPIRVKQRHDLTITGTPTEGDCSDKGPGPGDLSATVAGGDHVIKIIDSSNIDIRFLNIISGHEEGLEYKNSEQGEAHCNCVAFNDDDGVELDGGWGVTLSQNLVARNENDGIRLTSGTKKNMIVANTVSENGDDGIELDEGVGKNTITDNIVKDNEEDGIDLDGTDKNTVNDNEVTGNGTDLKYDSGIELNTSDYNTVDGNTIRDNADRRVDEIECESGTGNMGSNVTMRCMGGGD